MDCGVRLVSIPEARYADYRYDAIFKAYKWDPQVEDQNTVSDCVALMDKKTAEQLEAWAEQLSEETMLMEEALAKNISLAKDLGLPKKIFKSLDRLGGYDKSQHIRLMRIDFHPTTTGWAVSEVNSDVPGGLAEASVLPEIAKKYIEADIGCEAGKSTAKSLYDAFEGKIEKNVAVAFVHATSYADDRQVMQFLGDYFAKWGINAIFAAPDHIEWTAKKALCAIGGKKSAIDGIMRFFPLEWFVGLQKKSNWLGYLDCETVSCNHPIAIFAQSKRLPLVWDKLNLEIPAWRALLPKTMDPKSLGPREAKSGEWVYKPNLGRVGEGIAIKSLTPQKEFLKIEKSIRRYSADFVAQQKFESQPLSAANRGDQTYHLCVGAFTVNGKSAGFYARISPYPLIDSKAKDIPILISD
ncbi:MAG: glutathionylspermidine synthase family protein [Oscillospiraceae bacterium]|nr:glutathionylspermidine synthase family protein [Oscillospiraceae bacterium]